MSEVFKRDKKAKQLASIYAYIKRDRESATGPMVAVWKEEVAKLWSTFETLHEAVIDRSGVTELEEQQKAYDNASGVYYEARMLLETLYSHVGKQSLVTAAHAEPNGCNDLDQLQTHHKMLVKRFETVCNRIMATITAMNAIEKDIQRKDVEHIHNALRDIGLKRMLNNDDADVVMEIEAKTDALFIETLRVCCDGRDQQYDQVGGSIMGNSDQLKVPCLQITPFDGRFEQWEAFRESFTHGIHSRSTMPSIQKLQYLKSVLRDEPEELIRNFGLTAENYESAWKLLNERYDDKRELIISHFRILTSFVHCTGLADDLRRIINKTASSLLALKNLGRPIEAWDDWIVFHVCDKLDAETRRLWEQTQGNETELPTWDILNKFLQGRIRALLAAGSHTQIAPIQSKQNKVRAHYTANAQGSTATAKYVCGCCDQNHLISFCEEFRGMSPHDRRGIAAAKMLCFICLETGHQARYCTSSKRLCNKCNLKHNTMLHLHESNEEQTVQANTAACNSSVVRSTHVLLATAMVNVQGIGGEVYEMRALLDQGSECSFLSEKAADTLRLPRQKEKVDIVGLSGVATGRSTQSVTLCVSDRHGNGFSVHVHALIVPRVTSQLERFSTGTNRQWPHIANLQLADPDYLRSHKMDLLLGSDVYGTLLQPGLRKFDGLPTAQNTSFGWVLSGQFAARSDQKNSVKDPIMSHSISIDNQLAKFWEIEEMPSKRRLTEDEEKCETYFDETFTRDTSGRLHVRIPMKNSKILFGESQHFAVQRQEQIERKFQSNIQFAEQYRSFMEQYCALGHMCEVVGVTTNRSRSTNLSSTNEYYIPHHAVVKEASTTTKLRVVFDASRRTTKGISLNEKMMIGPKLQDDLTAIILRWRKYRIAFCADIEKMYRQIMVDEPDANLQRIVWRPTTNEPMKVYQLRTVTYGTASAPYLAIKSLNTLARLEQQRYPVGANIVLNNFYVDDVLSGADTPQECITSQRQLNKLLSSGGFTLRKWASNCDEV